MPKSKHRRQPGGKSVPHPGRGKPGKPRRLSWRDAPATETSTAGLPLFDWAAERPPRVTDQDSETDHGELT